MGKKKKGDTSKKECDHFILEVDEMRDILVKIRSLKQKAECVECLNNQVPPAHLVMCTDCHRCFCGALGAGQRHINRHAVESDHCNALSLEYPDYGHCYRCHKTVRLNAIISAADGCDNAVTGTPNPKEAVSAAVGCDNVVRGTPNPQVIVSAAVGCDNVVRGIPNLGNTCYINALVQCLLALGKLRVWMLGPDAPMGLLSMALKELFEETSTGNEYGLMMDPGKLLLSLGSLNEQYTEHTMEDSQELLLDLRNGLIGEEKLKWPPKMRDRVPTVVDSIFQGQTTTTLICKRCQFVSLSHDSFSELTLPLASKGQATKSVPSPQSDLEKAQIDAQGGDSKSVAEKAPEPLEADSTEAEKIQERKNAVHGTTEDKGKSLSTNIVCDEEEDSNSASIKHCLALYLKQDEIEWFCEPCSKARKEEGASFPEKDSASSSTENEESDRDGKADKKLDLPSVQDSQNASTPEDRRKQTDLNSAPQESENQNEKKDRKEDEDKTAVISKLPPVLTIHLKRFDRHSNVEVKITGHVSFEESFDVGQFMDPSGHCLCCGSSRSKFVWADSQDKANSTYGLVAVIEHIGNGLKYGHYVAYVRGSRIGSHRQLSSGSSWFRADDKDIKEVSLEEVLKREAYLLFYERMED
ncbi:hypothetical protein ACP70R_003625 [Stipagrostis hirtigluma subsp. patula]